MPQTKRLSTVSVIQRGEHFQPLLNLMRDSLLASRAIHCDETRVLVLKEPDREPSSQSWRWLQTDGPPDRPVILFDYSTSRAQECLLDCALTIATNS